MYLEKPGEIIEKNIPKPSPDKNEVLVEIKRVGVCGSDMEYYESGKIGEFVVKEPIILGHESSGQVVEVGEKVDDLQVGDRVALELGVPCRKCKYCKSGRYNLCPDVAFMATPPDDGAFVEYVAHPADFTFKLPDSVSLEEGALMEPLSVGVAATKRAEVGIGDKVAVLGSGPIGLVTMQAALAGGASEVVITDIIDFRLEKARQLGAAKAVNVKEGSLEEFNSYFDRVIQTAGTSGTYKQAMNLVDRGGRVVQVGHPSAEEVSIDPNILITKGFDMVGSFRYANTYKDAIDLVNSCQVELEPMISKQFSFDQIEGALNFPRENPGKCIKAMVDI